MKYLTEIEIRTLINLGKTLEIFLGRQADNNEIISWISLAKNNAGQVELSTHLVFDDGDINHLDIYSFEFVDPDDPIQTKEFSTPVSARLQRVFSHSSNYTACVFMPTANDLQPRS